MDGEKEIVREVGIDREADINIDRTTEKKRETQIDRK